MNYVDNKIHSRKLSAIYNICRRHINVSRECFLLRCYLMSKSFYTTMTITYLISSENDTEILESKTIYHWYWAECRILSHLGTDCAIHCFLLLIKTLNEDEKTDASDFQLKYHFSSSPPKQTIITHINQHSLLSPCKYLIRK